MAYEGITLVLDRISSGQENQGIRCVLYRDHSGCCINKKLTAEEERGYREA